jgi:GcrA cell cycle regulator|tara:strand:+ start:138 stop:638 length:501 start_codon:yes stop_codon:yes gene_type:complete
MSNWDEAREAKLKELWEKGHTASQIAEILGGTTRNAVIGKAHRLKLAGRAKSKKPEKQKRQLSNDQNKEEKYISRRARFRSLLLDKDFEPENPKKLEELDDKNCRWPIGHPDEENFYFCGRSPIDGFSYCKLHVLYAFQPKNPKEELIAKEDEVPDFIEKKVKASK